MVGTRTRPPRNRRPGRWLRRPTAAPAVVVGLLAALLPAAPATAADTTPPSTPGPTTTAEITETSIRLTWAPATDDVGVTGYDVSRQESDMIFLHSTPTSEITLTGLRPSRTYGFSVRARDAAGNISPGNGTLRVTMPPGDAQPPTTPGRPVASALTDTAVTLTWTPSSDNVYVARYDVLSITATGSTVVAHSPQHPPIGPTARVSGLSPGTTYTFAVRAVDDAGNVSALSEPVTVITTGGPAPGCAVDYRLIATWPNGHQAEVTVHHRGSTPIDGGTLRWTVVSGERIDAIWHAALVGVVNAVVTVRDVSYNSRIPAGGSVTFGLVGGGSGTTAPTAFALNDVPCETWAS